MGETVDEDALLKEFFAEVGEVERDNEVIRILSCFKLNPFEYLNLPFGSSVEDVKKQYRRLSLMVHPDKCKHPQAKEAFGALAKAQQQLLDQQERDYVLSQVKAAKEELLSVRKKQLKKDTASKIKSLVDEKYDQQYEQSEEFQQQLKLKVREILTEQEWRRQQVLPLVPPGRRANEEGSPYSGQDANCGNTLLISLDELVKDGLLHADELPKPIDADRVNFDAVAELKDSLVAKAAERLVRSEGELKNDLQKFRRDPSISSWLEDAAYFAAIDSMCNTLSWYEWPEPLKNRHLSALEKIYLSKKDFIDIFVAQQFLFQRQWKKIRNYAQLKGIKIMGDMPIYVGYHSADVWANKKQFLLNRKGFPLLVSGVPPDAFSETGQLWDSPLYDWKAMERDGFSWWTRRIRRAMDLYDEFRIDHFRGFAGFWAVPSEAKIATVGRWKAGPGNSLFDAIFRAVGKIDIIAEDLGVITEDVVQLRKSIGAPGMAVLQFGFGGDAENPHLPHNHEKNQVVYTGTHDNDTLRGWWDNLNQEERGHVISYLSLSKDSDISWELIRTVLSSVAKTAIVPMQDILGLGSSARMNIPATQSGNWSWRIPASVTFEGLDAEAKKLRDLLSMYGRL